MHLLTFFSIGGVMLPIRLISVSSAWNIYLHVKFTLSLKIAIYFSKEGWGGLIKFGRTYWGIGYLVRGGWFWRGGRVDHYLELLPPNLLVLNHIFSSSNKQTNGKKETYLVLVCKIKHLLCHLWVNWFRQILKRFSHFLNFTRIWNQDWCSVKILICTENRCHKNYEWTSLFYFLWLPSLLDIPSKLFPKLALIDILCFTLFS